MTVAEAEAGERGFSQGWDEGIEAGEEKGGRTHTRMFIRELGGAIKQGQFGKNQQEQMENLNQARMGLIGDSSTDEGWTTTEEIDRIQLANDRRREKQAIAKSRSGD